MIEAQAVGEREVLFDPQLTRRPDPGSLSGVGLAVIASMSGSWSAMARMFALNSAGGLESTSGHAPISGAGPECRRLALSVEAV